MTTITELADEVRMLELEEKKIGLEKRIAQLKAEPIIDGDCIGCAGPCSDRIKERLKAEEGEVARLRFIITREHGEAAKLQEELEDTEIKLVGCRKLIDDLDHTIRELSAMVEAKTKANQAIIHDKNTIIEELKDRNTKDLNELYEIDKEELDRLKNVISARDLTIESLTTKLSGKCAYIGGCEEELDFYRQDSKVLKKVVDEVKECGDATSNPSSYTRRTNAVTLDRIAFIVKDYLGAPEVPPETPIGEPQEITVTFAFLELP